MKSDDLEPVMRSGVDSDSSEPAPTMQKRIYVKPVISDFVQPVVVFGSSNAIRVCHT